MLTDGRVLVQDSDASDWWTLTPDLTGSYINGTWTQVASMPSSYGPLYFASAVLPDGRVMVLGGEYNFGVGAWTTLGAYYNPLKNVWKTLHAPSGWTSVGDAQSVILPNGTMMVANCCSTQEALLDAKTLTWTATGTGKADENDEEGWTLPAAIYWQDDARQLASLVAAKEDGCMGVIFGGYRSVAQRLFGMEIMADGGVLHGAGGHRRVDQSRGEHIDADAFGGIAGRGQPAHRQDSPLGGRVGIGIEKPRRRRQAEDARHIQNDTRLSFWQEVLDGGAVGQKGAFQVGVDRRLPAGVGAFVQGTVAMTPPTAAGHMIEHVQAAQDFDRVLEQQLHLDGVGRVAGEEMHGTEPVQGVHRQRPLVHGPPRNHQLRTSRNRRAAARPNPVVPPTIKQRLFSRRLGMVNFWVSSSGTPSGVHIRVGYRNRWSRVARPPANIWDSFGVLPVRGRILRGPSD